MRAACAVDAGEIINPDGLINQVEGGALHGMSRALFEEVTWDAQKVTSVDWRTYRTFGVGAPLPVLETVLINNVDEDACGAGEASITVVTAAIGNAIARHSYLDWVLGQVLYSLMEISVKRAEPRQISVVVRSPADFPAHSRSSPIRAPRKTARKSRARSSSWRGSRRLARSDKGASHSERGTRHSVQPEHLAHVVGYVAPPSERDMDGDPLLELPGIRVGRSGVERHHVAEMQRRFK
mgnify:CR=1 FL=1